MLILDLEDAVAPRAKAEARRMVREAIPRLRAAGARLAVRVNHRPDELEADLSALAATPIGTLMIPKATSAGLARVADRTKRLGFSERLRLLALIESARGLWDALPVAEHPMVAGLAIGEQDLAADLGLEDDADPMIRHEARSRLVWACAAAGLPGPIGPVWTDIGDLDGLRAFARSLRRSGFSAGSAIHPSQVPVINQVFAPSEKEMETARQLVEAYDRALSEGRGVVRDAEGKMVDEAVVRRARRLLR